MLTSEVTAATTSVLTGSFFQVPAGPATVILANQGTASPLYVGAGTNVSAGRGFPAPSGVAGPVVIPVYPGSPAGTWSVVTGAGGGTLSWIVSDPSSGTGP